MSATTSSDKSFQYVIDEDLKAVVQMAIKMEIPLLVTGDPGTGKTKLARYVADQVLEAELVTFNTKTTSKARDLLYHYNTLSHFRDSRQGEEVNPMAYISFQGLGKAIINSRKKAHVVLVDEIDKAPRDFPNDVLFEFENLAFEVMEASNKDLKEYAEANGWGDQVHAGVIRAEKDSQKPFLILTSNSEKNLPDAFLRRCMYYHIPFPSSDRLKEIIHKNVDLRDDYKQSMLDDAIDHFLKIRDLNIKKKPATAELVSWVHALQDAGIDLRKGLDGDDEEIKRKIRQTYSLLTKNKEDRDRLFNDMTLL